MSISARWALALLLAVLLSGCSFRTSDTEQGFPTAASARGPAATSAVTATRQVSLAPTGTTVPIVLPSPVPTELPTQGGETVTAVPGGSSTPTPTREPAPTATRPPPRTPTGEPSPTATPSEPEVPLERVPDRTGTADPRIGIQSVVDRHYDALNRADLELFYNTIDTTNTYWKAVQEEQYLLWPESYGGATASARVVDVEPVGDGFYRADLLLTVKFDSGEQGQVAQTWVFRRIRKRWRLSEPTAEQLGRLRRKDGDRVTLEYYAWDEWQADHALRLADKSIKKVIEQVGVRPRRRVQVRLLPAYEVSPGSLGGHSVGYYRSVTPNLLFVRSPGSYGFGAHDPSGTPYTELGNTLVHELTHLLGDRRVPLDDLPDWMTEGLAEWVSESPREYEVYEAIESDNLWDLTLLADFSVLSRDVSLAYGQSYELVDYIIEQGGVDAYWELAGAYQETEGLDASLRHALKMSREEFDRRWLRWLRDKYDVE